MPEMRLPVVAVNGRQLRANSAEALGVKWDVPCCGGQAFDDCCDTNHAVKITLTDMDEPNYEVENFPLTRTDDMHELVPMVWRVVNFSEGIYAWAKLHTHYEGFGFRGWYGWKGPVYFAADPGVPYMITYSIQEFGDCTAEIVFWSYKIDGGLTRFFWNISAGIDCDPLVVNASGNVASGFEGIGTLTAVGLDTSAAFQTAVGATIIGNGSDAAVLYNGSGLLANAGGVVIIGGNEGALALGASSEPPSAELSFGQTTFWTA